MQLLNAIEQFLLKLKMFEMFLLAGDHEVKVLKYSNCWVLKRVSVTLVSYGFFFF